MSRLAERVAVRVFLGAAILYAAEVALRAIHALTGFNALRWLAEALS